MPAPGQPWPLHLKVAVSPFYAIAIGSGIFRLAYRCYNSHFGWEDTWALLALLTGIASFICAWLEQSAPLSLSETAIALNWVGAISLTSVLWAARLSMITVIIRITNPHASTRRVSYAIAVTFGLMWIAVLAQKLYNCGTLLSPMSHSVAISQLISDVISDGLLVAMPTFYLRDVKISRGQRVLLISSFASSICITIFSIAHSVVLFLPRSSTSLFIAHMKTALAVVVCNLLVILVSIYRFYHKSDMDPGGVPIDNELVQFSTVIPGQFSLRSCSCPTSLPSHRVNCTPSS